MSVCKTREHRYNVMNLQIANLSSVLLTQVSYIFFSGETSDVTILKYTETTDVQFSCEQYSNNYTSKYRSRVFIRAVSEPLTTLTTMHSVRQSNTVQQLETTRKRDYFLCKTSCFATGLDITHFKNLADGRIEQCTGYGDTEL